MSAASKELAAQGVTGTEEDLGGIEGGLAQGAFLIGEAISFDFTFGYFFWMASHPSA